MNKEKLSITSLFIVSVFVMLAFVGMGIGEYRWYYDKSNYDTLLSRQTVNIEFENSKFVSKSYITVGCNDNEKIDDGYIEYLDENTQEWVVASSFTNAGCGYDIIFNPIIKTTNMRLTMLIGGGSDNMISWYCCGSKGWKVYAGDDILVQPTETIVNPTPTPTRPTWNIFLLLLLMFAISSLLIYAIKSFKKKIPVNKKYEKQYEEPHKNERERRAETIPYYYRVLGVNKNSTVGEIKDAYRKLVMIYHPDVSAEPDSEKKFKEIRKAYEVLSDHEKRAQYNRFENNPK